MYSSETIKKVVRALTEKTNQYMMLSPDKVKECISTGNRKIGNVLNVSLAPILTCANCAQCMHYCYDVNACARYSNTVVDARARNTALFRMDRNEFFKRLDNRMSRRRANKALRFHVSGDIVDYDHFDRMMALAIKYAPRGWDIWTYTKNYTVVNEWIARHGGNKDAVLRYMKVMFSEWKGLPMDNPYGMPVFSCTMKGDPMPAGIHVCPGNCNICRSARRGCVVGETSTVREH